jgi:hypothetical protein
MVNVDTFSVVPSIISASLKDVLFHCLANGSKWQSHLKLNLNLKSQDSVKYFYIQFEFQIQIVTKVALNACH